MQMRTIVRRWMGEHLRCVGGTQPAQLLYYALADRVADRIMAAVTRGQEGGRRVLAMLDPYNREGSSRHVSFMTSKDRYATGPSCHINLAVIDSDSEAEFCRVADRHRRVLAWVKNHNLGFEVSSTPSGPKIPSSETSPSCCGQRPLRGYTRASFECPSPSTRRVSKQPAKPLKPTTSIRLFVRWSGAASDDWSEVLAWCLYFRRHHTAQSAKS
jgi:hypothetical protein